MEQYEPRRQIRLDWFAAFHDSETHPHCHVIIKAVCENRDGQEMRLRFNKEDLRELRQTAGKALAYKRYQHQAPERAASALERERMRTAVDRLTIIQHGIDWIREQIRQHRRRAREEEDEHQRWLRDEGDRDR